MDTGTGIGDDALYVTRNWHYGDTDSRIDTGTGIDTGTVQRVMHNSKTGTRIATFDIIRDRKSVLEDVNVLNRLRAIGISTLSCVVLCRRVSTLSSVVPDVTSRVSPPGPVVEGTTVSLVCEATAGDSPISYSWTGPNGHGVSPGDTDGTVPVRFSASGDYGNYTCTAANEVGMDTAIVEVVRASEDI